MVNTIKHQNYKPYFKVLRSTYGYDNFRPHQLEIISAIGDGNDCMAVLPTSAGKCFGRGTKILMFDGSVSSVEDVRVGDKVMGVDGRPRTITETHSGFGELYQVKPAKGESYIVNSEHILTTKTTPCKSFPLYKSQCGSQIINVSVKDWIKKTKNFRHIHKGWRTGVLFCPRKINDVITPYYLGLWLGNGSTNGAAVYSAEPEVKAYMQKYADNNNMKLSVKHKRGCDSLSVVTPTTHRGRGKKNKIFEALKQLGVWGNKHIPSVYKINGRDVLLELLAGIIDTDGYCSHGGYDIVFKQKALADDVVFVARSLGLAAYVKPCLKKCFNNGKVGKYYRISIYGNTSIIPCKVERRKAGIRKKKRSVLVTAIKVSLFGYGEYYGFETDGDHLFLLADFTAVHNSICFQIPSLVRKGCAIIVTPLISLMHDQVVHARKRGIAATLLTSDQTPDEKRRVYDALRAGRVKLLYISPERLAVENFRELIHSTPIAAVIVDESHCICEYLEYRPEYTRIADHIAGIDAPVAAFTATATQTTQDTIIAKLRLRRPVIVRGSANRPNLFYQVVPKQDNEYQQIARHIEDKCGGHGIIYRTTRQDVERTIWQLGDYNIKCLPYHAGLAPKVRSENQAAFLDGRCSVMVATIAFGLGIDKGDVRWVLHADLPKSLEGYCQEAGRAGRDGTAAVCTLLYSIRDIAKTRQLIEGAQSPEAKQMFLKQFEAMIRYAQGHSCRRKSLLKYFGETLTVSCESCDVCGCGPEYIKKFLINK
jgi:RecQ family ATP-dependent DNA helicase